MAVQSDGKNGHRIIMLVHQLNSAAEKKYLVSYLLVKLVRAEKECHSCTSHLIGAEAAAAEALKFI